MGLETPKRVLVVDDDPAIRLLVERVLSKNGFEADTATDGAEALAKLEEHHFDLLILDLMMPRVNGFDVVEQLVQAGEKAPKILVMTAASPAVLRDFPRDRVEKIISKPFELQTLVNTALEATSAKNGTEPAPK